MTRTTLLVSGKIPAGTPCHFMDICPSAENKTCGHHGAAHTVDYSCGAARAFDLQQSTTVVEQKTKTIEVGTRLIDGLGLIWTVNHVNTNLSDLVLFTVQQNTETFAYFPKDNKFTTNPYLNKQDINFKFFEIELNKEYLDNEGYQHYFAGKEAIITQPDGSKHFHNVDSLVYTQDGIYHSDIPAMAIAGEANDHVRAVLNERKHKREDFVDVAVSDLEAIPKDSNPFHFDLGNMGTTLVNGWIVMHAGPPHESNPSPTTYLILVNTHSGQRIKLDLSKRK
jgi:hypothetical protein